MSLLLHVVLLSGCMFSYTPAGPTYLGEERVDARLTRIAASPSEAGAEEAMARWIAAPSSLAARRAVLACAQAFPATVEARFGEVREDGRKAFFDDAQRALTGEAASALLARLSRASGMADKGVTALAGRQDAAAVQSLLETARGSGPESTRSAAIAALEPPSTPLARDGLLALARDPGVPVALRADAVAVLAPFDTPEVRGPMLALAAQGDDAAARAVLFGMGPARDDAELGVVLAAAGKDLVAGMAVQALERTYADAALPAAVEAQLVTMVNVSGPAPTGSRLEARFQAVRVLSAREDARAFPALVRLLDTDGYGSSARGLLEELRIAMVPTLARDAAILTTPRARQDAARLLATFGGPQHAELLRTLVPAKEAEALVAQLATAPWGLFPEGRVAYVPAVTDPAQVEQSLLEAMRAGDALRRDGGDPVTRYVGAARAYLAGSRGRAGEQALRDTAAAARSAFGLAVRPRVTVTGDAALAGRVLEGLTSRVVAQSGVKPITRTEPAGAALSVAGSLSCTVEDTTTRTRLPDATYGYQVQVHNAVKDELERLVRAFPEAQKTVQECWLDCTDNPGTTAQRKFRTRCDPQNPDYIGGVDRVCRRTISQVANPEYTVLVDRYTREPETFPHATSVPMTQIEVTTTHAERCDGPLTLGVGSAMHATRVAYAGRSSTAVVERSAQPVGASQEPLAPWRDTQPGEGYDDLKAAFEAALVASLGAYRPTESDVRRMYAEQVRLALQAGDYRSARQALLWSQPELVGADVASLQAFRKLLFSTDNGGFPRGWR